MRKIQTKILNPQLVEKFGIPQHQTDGSAGIDLRAMVTQDFDLAPGETILISTGMAVYVEDPNLCAALLPRSGIGHKHGIVLGNLVGLIDSDYQGELFVSLWNRSNTPYVIKAGERIAQMVFLPIAQVELDIVEEFSIRTARNTGGTGHTGIM